MQETITHFCPVCGNKHPEISNCPKYGVNVCSAHCEICEYRIGNLPVSGGHCGYRSSTRALKLPVFLAPEEEVAKAIKNMQDWSFEDIASRYAAIKEAYNNRTNSASDLRIILAACQRIMLDRAGDAVAEAHIPQMQTEDIFNYRRELCRYIAADKYNPRLRYAVDKALQVCNDTLKKRGEIQ